MPAFFNNETKVIPDVYYNDKTFFFKAALKGTRFFCELFNSAFEISYQDRLITHKRTFKENQFVVSDIQFSPTERVIFIELPLPILKKDWEVTYLKSYCIPYLQYNDRIEILDLYAEQGRADRLDEGIIIKFAKDADYKPCAAIKGDRQNTLGAMYQIIFKDYDPYNKRADF